MKRTLALIAALGGSIAAALFLGGGPWPPFG
jgi:hypothetical protein